MRSKIKGRSRWKRPLKFKTCFLYGLFYLYMFFLAPLFQKFNQRFFRHLVNQTIGQATKLDHTFIGRIHLYCEIGFLRFLRLSYKEYAGLALDNPI